MHRDAFLSEDGLYRYALTRTWALGPVAAFAMLNSSTADGLVDDPTVKKCIGFAQLWGCGSIYIANAYSYRTAYPKVLFEAQARGVDIVGPRNQEFLLQAASIALVSGGKLVVAWGANAPLERAREIGHMPEFRGAQCLGVNKDGSPKHPLMLPYSSVLEPWDVDRLAS